MTTDLLEAPSERLNGEKTSTVLVQQLRAQVMEMLDRGRPGDRIPPERELARLYNVSHMTIGRVIQDLQQEGIVQRIRGKGTFIANSNGSLNNLPQLGENLTETLNRLPFGENGTSSLMGRMPAQRIAILVKHTLGDTDDITIRRRQWHYRALSQVELQVQRLGGSTILIDLTEESGDVLYDRLCLESPDAIIVIPVNSFDGDWTTLRRYRKQAAPTVPIACINLGNSIPSELDSASYDSDNGILLALDHLLELGHTRIGYVFPEAHPEYKFLQQRIDVMSARLRESGLALQLFPVQPDMTGQLPSSLWEVSGRDAARQVHQALQALDAPTAVLAVNDMMAGSLLSQLRQLDPEIAGRLAVVGYDNDLMWGCRHNLTTIHPPIEELADCALALARQRLQRPFDGSIHVTLQPQLIVRRSTFAPL